MRRHIAKLSVAAMAAIAIVLGATAALAQKMDFRPLPPESVSRIASGAHAIPSVRVHAPGRNGQQGVDVQVDSNGVLLHLPGGASAGVSGDEPPSPPEPPEPGSVSAHETTGDIVRFGSSIVVREGQVVNGDVLSMGGSVRVDGTVRGSVTSMGGNVTLNNGSRVDGDVVCLGGTLREEPGSSVGGQHVTAPRVPGGHFLLPMLSVVGTGVRVVTHLVGMLILLGIAFVTVKLAPSRTRFALDEVGAAPAMTFLTGLLMWGMLIPTVILVAIAFALLCITIIGIPVGIALLVGYGLLYVLLAIWGAVVGYALLGERLLLRFRGGPADLVRAAVWGVVGLYGLRIAGDLMHVIPVFSLLGGFINFIAIASVAILATMGAGALVRTEYRRRTVQDWWTHHRPGRAPRPADDFPPPPAPESPVAPTAPPAPAATWPVPPPPPPPAAPPAPPPPTA